MRVSKLKVRLLRFWREYARPFLFVAVVLMTFRSSIADWNDVPSGSMNPTILEGDRIFVNKLAYDLKVPFTTWHLAEWGSPQRGDIVVFYSPVDGIRLVKRVVGVSGDVVQMVDGTLTINGRAAMYGPLDQEISKPLAARYPGARFAEEFYGDEHHPVMALPNVYSPVRNFGPVTVPAGEFFMMGDNRDNSNDSRFYGGVKRELILGRASRIVASVDSLDKYQPRWKRFFAPLP